MTNRKINIEFIRIFAIIMVIAIHVANVYIRKFNAITESYFLISVIFSSVSKICVPLFFMIGGAFSLDKEYDSKKYFERVKKFIIILVIWSVIYYLTKNGFNFNNIGKVITNSFFNADMTSRHLWYMYPLIGIYIALPFIQNMCKNLTPQQEKLFLNLWFWLSGLSFIYLPLAELITKTNVELEYPIPLINSAYYIGYFISGHILYKRFKNSQFDKKKNIICISAYIVSTAIIILLTYFISVKSNSFLNSPSWYRSALVIIAAFSVFILVVANADKFKSNFIIKISKHTFGIYLIHMIFLNIIKQNINIVDLNPAIAIPVVTIIVYAASLVACIGLSKIPFINKIIF